MKFNRVVMCELKGKVRRCNMTDISSLRLLAHVIR